MSSINSSYIQASRPSRTGRESTQRVPGAGSGMSDCGAQTHTPLRSKGTDEVKPFASVRTMLMKPTTLMSLALDWHINVMSAEKIT